MKSDCVDAPGLSATNASVDILKHSLMVLKPFHQYLLSLFLPALWKPTLHDVA
jgi:hypothetical protein